MADLRGFAAVCIALVGTAAGAADYVTVRNTVTVHAPLDRTWARIGPWCAIADWLPARCETLAGSDDVGAVRRLNGETVEVMVAREAHSYTYWQTTGTMAPYGYHGTLAAATAGPDATSLTYTLVYDQAAMPSDAVRASEHARLQARFAGALQSMKTLVERPR